MESAPEARITAGQIARPSPSIAPQDRAAKAVALVRRSGLSALPVGEGGRIVGIVSERDLFAAMAGGPGAFRALRVEEVMTRELIVVPDSAGLDAALHAFQETGRKVLPVVDSFGRLRGVLTRSDLVAALAGTIAPPAIGGLATPIGVHLHSITARGGVSDLALMLAGVMIAVLFLVASGVIQLLAWGADYLFPGVGILPLIVSGEIPATSSYYGVQPWIAIGSLLATYVIFLALLRLSPMSGYHAAEHQTVHVIEEGDDLVIDEVARRSPVHPRCGTNLVALLVLFTLILIAYDTLGEYRIPIMMALLVILALTWRRIGPVMQAVFTTKRPSRRQLESGLAAGRALLAAYRSSLGRPVPAWRRIWNIGLVQVILGMLVAYGIGWIYIELGGPTFFFLAGH